MKILYLIIVSIHVNILHAQNITPSKGTTQKWITEKLNRYVATETISCSDRDKWGYTRTPGSLPNCTNFKNPVFYFAGNNLIVTGNYTYDFKSVNRKLTIPIYALSDIYFTSGSIMFLTSFSAIKINDDNNDVYTLSAYSFTFNFNEEENFEVRFNKAVKYLKSLTKKPANSEAF